MEKSNSKKIEIKKLLFSPKLKNEIYSSSSTNNIKNKINDNNNKIYSPEIIKIKKVFNFNDSSKQKILNKIKKCKSRQCIFNKSKYFFYDKNEKDIKTNDTLKITLEMENKFYNSSRLDFKKESKSNILVNTFQKSLTKRKKKKFVKYNSLINIKNIKNNLIKDKNDYFEDLIKKIKCLNNQNFFLISKKKRIK